MTRPRIGFFGTGWIGRHRMAAMIATGAIEPAFICDPDPASLAAARTVAPEARALPDLAAMLAERPDGIVIATPSAGHAGQAIAALAAGAHVFCQKPLGRNAREVAAVLSAAAAAGKSLAVDFSYRHSAAFRAVKALAESGALGRIIAIEAVFHNGYGPDKPWFHDQALAGGGCLIDLGIHLADMIGQLLGRDDPACGAITAQLLDRAGGCPGDGVESWVSARFTLVDGPVCDLRCSWHAHVGCDAEIALRVFGTDGAALLGNVGGSFHDLAAWRHSGTRGEAMALPPDDWGGRAAAAWAIDPAAAGIDESARFSTAICDAIYRAGQSASTTPFGLTRADRAAAVSFTAA